MPHRKSPSAYAINLLRQSALFDVKTKEHLNRINQQEFTSAIEEQFPQVDVNSLIQSLPPSALTDGLVLQDRRGDGALQVPGKPYPKLKVPEVRLLMRQEVCEKHRAIYQHKD